MNSTNPVNNTSGTAVPSASAASNTGTGAGSSFGNRVKGVFEVIHGVGDNIRGTAMGAVDTMGHSGVTKNDEIARQGRLETQRGMAHLKGKPVPSEANETQYAGYPRDPISRATQQPYSEPPLETQPPEQGLSGSTGPSGYSHDATRETGTGSYPTEHQTTDYTGNYGHGGGAHHQVPGVADTAQSGTTGTGPFANAGYPAHDNTGAEGYPSHHRDDAISGVPPNLPPRPTNEVQGAAHSQAQPPYAKSPMSSEPVAGMGHPAVGPLHPGNAPVNRN